MSGPNAQAHGAAGAVLVVAATTLVLTLASLAALAPAAVAPELARGRGVSASLIGLQVSLVYAGGMLTSMVGGSVMRRLGACRASQLSLLLVGAGLLLAGLPSVATLALASVVIGLGYGLTNPAASHLLTRFTGPERRNLIFSLKQTGVPLGGVLAGLLVPVLVLSHGAQAAFATLAVVAVAAALALQPARTRWDDDRDPSTRLVRSPFAGVALVWRTRSLRRVSLAALAFAAIQLCVSAYTVTLLVEDVGFGLVAAGAVMSAVQVCGVGGRLLWGWLADRLRNGPLTLTLCALLSGAGCAAVTLLSPQWPQAAVVTVLCALATCAIGWNGVYLAEVARRSPTGEVAAATGGSLVFTYSGVLLGPSGFALAHALTGSHAATFGLLVAAAAAAAVCTRRLARTTPA